MAGKRRKARKMAVGSQAEVTSNFDVMRTMCDADQRLVVYTPASLRTLEDWLDALPPSQAGETAAMEARIDLALLEDALVFHLNQDVSCLLCDATSSHTIAPGAISILRPRLAYHRAHPLDGPRPALGSLCKGCFAEPGLLERVIAYYRRQQVPFLPEMVRATIGPSGQPLH